MARIQLVWFKRDLRVRDHAPLAAAAARGPCLFLYVYEPELIAAPEFDVAHLQLANDSLRELARSLARRGGRLLLRRGRMPDVLEQLWREVEFEAIWAHEETGPGLTYARDERVRNWARARGVALHELPQTGVVRGLRTRDGWAERWRERMSAPVVDAPRRVFTPDGAPEPGRILTPADFGLARSGKELPRGGERAGRSTLATFLNERGRDYRTAMSSPLTAWRGCSRIGPHLALGNLSMRQVHHATRRRVADGPPSPWPSSLASFEKRLHWRCHFMQKLEDEPDLEFFNLSRAFDGLREDEFDSGRFAAWCEGRTGFPMVDACMRSLEATGWLNFRMRAMVVSFASYDLWLHWRPTGLFLGRHFIDFEAGVHWSQMQMQSGVTGINALRMYSPAKQARDQDPDGVFIRRWVPELAAVPVERLANPTPEDRRRAGYPPPIIDHREAVREARRRIMAVRRRADARDEARRVHDRHGSRRRPLRRRTAKASPS